MSEKDDQTEILKEILKWIKVSSYKQIKDFLGSNLKTETEKLIYHFSDGTNSTIQVVEKAHSSKQKVSDSWKKWRKFGIGENVNVTGGMRFKRNFDLGDFGLLPKDLEKGEKNE